MSFVDSEDSESWCFEKNRRSEVYGSESHQQGRQGRKRVMEAHCEFVRFHRGRAVRGGGGSALEHSRVDRSVIDEGVS